MTEYIKNFVTGNGIHFEINKKNSHALEVSTRKWKHIYQKLNINSNSVILYCGAKNNGKSSLLRYSINRYVFGIEQKLSHDDNDRAKDHCNNNDDDQNNIQTMDDSESTTRSARSAYFIDFDPGQPEMTTPGCVSVHLIESSSKPLESPTYLNLLQHKPLLVSSVGGTNMSVNPRMYIENCREIVNKVRECRSQGLSDGPVFINTMGYIRNVGLAMLMDLIKICRPTNVVVLNVLNHPMRSIYADLGPRAMQSTQASFYYETKHGASGEANVLDYDLDVRNLKFVFVDSSSVSNRNRTALQLAYLGSMPEAIYKPVLQIEPKFLSLDEISVHCASSYPLTQMIVLDILLHSWVHLVSLRNRSQTQPAVTATEVQTPQLCTMIENIGQNSFLGCAIVTEVDLEKRRLRIVTPLTQLELQQVNCVIKPLSIQVPEQVMRAAMN